MKIKIFLLTTIFLIAVSNVYAVTIDLTVFSSGNTGSTVLVTPEATFNSFGDNFFISAAGIDSELCALNGGNCESDFEIVFNNPIENLTLVTSGYNSGDSVEFFAYDEYDALLGSVTQAANGLVDITAFSFISRLFVDDSSTAAGFGYDAITFDWAQPVPEPATMLLFGLGILGLAGVNRRKK